MEHSWLPADYELRLTALELGALVALLGTRVALEGPGFEVGAPCEAPGIDHSVDCPLCAGTGVRRVGMTQRLLEKAEALAATVYR